MTKLESKKGISLIILALTIVVIIIITTAIVVNTTDNRANALKTLLVEDLNSVEEAVRTYYIVNGSMPLPKNQDALRVLNSSQVVSLATDNMIEEEILLNGDEDKTFYVINLSLLDLENLTSGTAYEEDESLKVKDIYVVSSQNFNVYYLLGQEIKGARYYSLSSRLTGIDRKLSQNAEDSSISAAGTIIYNGKIKVLKDTTSNNSLDSKIITNLEYGDELRIETLNNTVTPTVKLGENIYTFKDILSAQQIEDVVENGIINIKIYQGNILVEQRTVNVVGALDSAPTISDTNEVSSYLDENTISFNVIKGNSDIDYVKYGYFNVFDSSSQNGYSSYHSQLQTAKDWVDYIKENGKKINISSSGRCSITVPKNVRDIIVIAKDKKGNISYMSKNIYDFYAKASLKTQTSSTTEIESDIVAPINTRVRMSYSSDNNTYSMPQEITTNSINYKATIKFDNLVNYNIYVKTTLIINGNSYDFIDKIETLKKVDYENEQTSTDNLSLTISADRYSPTSSPEIIYSFKFSKNVLGFDINDIEVRNGDKIDFVGSGSEYRLKVVNTANTAFIQEVIVPENACTDSSGNKNDAVSIVMNVNREVPSLYKLYVSEPLSGTYVTGQTVTISAIYDGKVCTSNGNSISTNISQAPQLKIRIGSGIVREVSPTYVGEVENTITNLSSSNTDSKFTGSLINYIYTIREEDYGDLVLESYNGTIYSEAKQSRYISTSSLVGNKIKVDRPLCRIDNQNYGGIQEAINAASSSITTISLISNVDTTTAFDIPEGKNISVKLNGYTISSSSSVFTNEGMLTIEGNGNVNSLSSTGYAIENNGILNIYSVSINTDGKGILNYGENLKIKSANINSKSYGIYSINRNAIAQIVDIDRLTLNIDGNDSIPTALYLQDTSGNISNTISNARLYYSDTSGSLATAKKITISKSEFDVTTGNAIYNDKGIIDISKGTYTSSSASSVYNNQGAIHMYETEIKGASSSVSSYYGDIYINVGTFKSTSGDNINIDGGNLIINEITFDTKEGYKDVYAKSPATVYYYKELSFNSYGDGLFIRQEVKTDEPVYI